MGVDLIGDLCIPKELIVPTPELGANKAPTMSGALFLSGSKLYFVVGGAPVLITSA